MALMRLIFGAAVVLCAAITSGHASTVVSWIQLGPGSSPAALTAGSYGDQPASLTPTILARSLITSRSGGCPAATLEDGTVLAMNARFDGSTLHGLNSVGGLTAFVTNSTQGNLSNGDPAATTDWTVCEAVVPPGHVTATVDGTRLQVPLANPNT